MVVLSMMLNEEAVRQAREVSLCSVAERIREESFWIFVVDAVSVHILVKKLLSSPL